MLFKLKRNKYGITPSSLPYAWLEVLAITPARLLPVEGEGFASAGYHIEASWLCRTDQGIVQIPGRKMDQEIALELFVDSAMEDAKLREKMQLLHRRADVIEKRIITASADRA